MRTLPPCSPVRLSVIVGVACAFAAGCADGPPSIAGGWLQCDPAVDDTCSETLDVGFYFPPDGGPLLELHRRDDGSFVCTESGLYYVSSWVEQEDGSVFVDHVPVYLTVLLERDGDLLGTASDGSFYTYPGDFMTKVIGPEVCSD